jgi:hypothetical protein
MSKQFTTNNYEDQAAVQDGTWEDIQKAAAKFKRARITVESYSEAAELSDQQRKWFKGVLLKQLREYSLALSKDTGDTALYWENYLKTAVMPEEFQPKTFTIDGKEYAVIPSITKLSISKMNLFIPAIVEHLREICGLKWVTLPDETKRSGI